MARALRVDATNGSLYTVSEHVAPPLTFRQVVQNLDRMIGGLVVRRADGLARCG